MKVALLTSEYITESMNWYGGLANYLGRVVLGLIRRGHQVHVFVYSNDDKPAVADSPVIHRIRYNDRLLQIANKLTRRLCPGFLQMVYAARLFKKYFIKVNQTEKFDIVHASSCLTPALFLDSNMINAPIVTRMSSIMKYCQIANNRKNFIDVYLMNLAEKRMVKKSDRVFAPSALVKKAILKEFKREIEMIESPNFPIDSSDYDDAVFKEYLDGKKYLLFYGTLSRLKGSEFIARVIGRFLKEFPDYYFVFVGKMISYKKNELPIEPILRSAGEARDRIIFINSLRHRFLIPIIKNAQAVILPSIIDNMPNTCIEAMSMGKVVVGTYEGGFDQMISDQENGFLVKYGDIEEMINILRGICVNGGKLLEKISHQAKCSMAEKLNFDDKLNELIDYYQSSIDFFRNKPFKQDQ